jgi:hypothetical protein
MNKTYCLLLCLVLLTGCVTSQARAVKQKISKVDYSHQISKEDAATIAQNYVLVHKIPVYTLSRPAEMGNFVLASGQIIDVWKVKFSQKKIKDIFLPVSYEVDVNIKNGEVVHSERWM